MLKVTYPLAIALSPSSRRAWVEITYVNNISIRRSVALLAEGVGRNRQPLYHLQGSSVALLAEGVGRNWDLNPSNPGAAVALLAEGVGRNVATGIRRGWGITSPSSRRAWVEIAYPASCR